MTSKTKGLLTFHSYAIADAALEHQGRFSGVVPQPVVTGSSPSSQYPRLPRGNSFASDPVPAEPLIDARDCGPTLGYAIDEQECVPTSGRLAPEEDAGVGADRDDGAVASTPSTLSPEAEEERRAALEDRMHQIGMSAPKEEANPPLEAAREPASLSVQGGAGSLPSKQTVRRRV